VMGEAFDLACLGCCWTNTVVSVSGYCSPNGCPLLKVGPVHVYISRASCVSFLFVVSHTGRITFAEFEKVEYSTVHAVLMLLS
jgi:hypothetical protein